MSTLTEPLLLEIDRVYAVSPAELYEAWTRKEHLDQWCAPAGFVVTSSEGELRPGGAWHSNMRSPSGEDYPLQGEYRELIPGEKVSFTTAWIEDDGQPGTEKLVEVRFSEVAEGSTRMTFRQEGFDSAESRDSHRGGWGECFDKLGAYLSRATNDSAECTIVREFAASRERLFRAWTNPEEYRQWFGPKGLQLSYLRMEPTPGGICQYGIALPNGDTMHGKATYLEVTPEQSFVCTHGFCGADGKTTVHPKAPDWPLLTWNHYSFEDLGENRARVTLRTRPFQAEERQRTAFAAGRAGLEAGMEGMFTQLDEFLAKAATAAAEAACVITQQLPATPERIFHAWTTPEEFRQWFSPRGCELVHLEMQPQVGGRTLLAFAVPGQADRMWARMVYQELTPPNRLVWLHSFSDATGGVTRHPSSPGWPPVMRITMELMEGEGETVLTLRVVPNEASATECEAFRAGHAGLQAGFGATLGQLKEYLAQA